jgi:exodeoxyribonuclease-3
MVDARRGLRVYSWNVNGLRAIERKGLLPWTLLEGADVICLQETKASPGQIDAALLAPEGWSSHWHSAEKKGYSGTAIYTRREPDDVLMGLGNPDFDREGRALTLRFGRLCITSAYFPNSQEAGARLDYKIAFCEAVLEFQRALLGAGYETALFGDYNIAHRPIDLARPKENEKNPGYLPEERDWMSRYLEAGFRDVWRERHPDREGVYTWWSFRTGARERNVGWRIDYGCVSPKLADDVIEAEIRPEIPGSDHCPIGLVFRAEALDRPTRPPRQRQADRANERR